MNYLFLLILFALPLMVVPMLAGTNQGAETLQTYLDESEQYMLFTLDDVSDEHWSYKSSQERWSIKECAEHILVAEQAILSSIKQQIETGEPVQKAELSTDEQVLNIVYDRVNKKVKTLEPFEPRGIWETREEFIVAFEESRKQLYTFIKNNDIDLSQYFTQSPAGEVSLRQMLFVLASHTARHTHQIEEIKAELGLSTAPIGFGGSVKVNVLASEKENIRKLFGEILLLEIDQQKKYDRVLFDGGGFVVFYYQEDENKVLTKEAFANSMQAGLRISPAYYESVKRRVISSGAEAYDPGYEVDPIKTYYFHAPGGQVFRLIKAKESAS